VAGAVLTGLSFALVWIVPVHWPQSSQLAWFLGHFPGKIKPRPPRLSWVAALVVVSIRN
jgi:hypothetical protein